MKFKQEYIAENLYKELSKHFKNQGSFIKVSIEGAGVHWSCHVESKNRKSTIHCFEHRSYDDIKPEYLISFKESEKNKAWGRTHSIEQAISCSEEWLHDKGVDFLYKKYSFIDWYKRRIEYIQEKLITHQPELERVEKRLISAFGSGLYDYQIELNNRSCKLSGYGKDEPFSFQFQWDKYDLFEVRQNDLSLLANVLKRWLIDEIAPSQLSHQFTWIDIGDVAVYYEKGEGIKGEFIESWNSIEKFYKQVNRSFAPKALTLIGKMRSRGFDNKIRAGQSLYTFILSRSRRHGLTQEQNLLSIAFSVDKDEMKVTDKSNTPKLIGKIEYTSKLEDLLEELTQHEIN